MQKDQELCPDVLEAVSGGKTSGGCSNAHAPIFPSKPQTPPAPKPKSIYDLWCNTCQAFVDWDLSGLISVSFPRTCPVCGGHDTKNVKREE